MRNVPVPLVIAAVFVILGLSLWGASLGVWIVVHLLGIYALTVPPSR